MPEAKTTSKLNNHGFSFQNWAGPGEAAAEQFGLSHAVIKPANARTAYIGGQVGIRDDGTVSKSIEEEIHEAFKHVELALKAAGLGDDAWEYVYKVNTYHAHTDSIPEFGAALTNIARGFWRNTRPVWTAVDVHDLLLPELHLEVEVEAFLTEG